MDLVTQDSYEKRHKQSTIPPALTKEKETKRRTNTKNTTAKQTELPEKCRNNTKKHQLWILWTTKLVTFTQRPGKIGRMQ